MKWSRSFIPTLREDPSDAELASHRLMVRAGMMRKLASGIYSYLPLGWRVIRKAENIVREEMDAKNAVELHLPILCPSDLWKESGRWEAYGDSLWKITDRGKNDFCLGPTHEEVITDLIRRDVQSYKQLPLNLYQIQTKVRDEVRPRFGLMRAREFVMKDAYSFHVTQESLEETYHDMYDAYHRIFRRCGFQFKVVQADSGSIGGKVSHEFMVLALSGEDSIVSCPTCNYAANLEKAESKPMELPTQAEGEPVLELVDTPGAKTIRDLERFFSTGPALFIKSLIYMVSEKPVAVLVRGDYEVCEAKLSSLFGGKAMRLASDDEVRGITGVGCGFVGPVKLQGISTIVADRTVKEIRGGVAGANQADKHYKGVMHGRDFSVNEFADLKLSRKRDLCVRCNTPLEFLRGIETGHIFKLGTKYSETMGATFLDDNKKSVPCVMGCYGIGITRIVAAAVEQNFDKDGIIWPVSLAPYSVVVSNLDPSAGEITQVSESLYETLCDHRIETILDDRNERPGVKFKDADLIGFPLRINVGSRSMKEGMVEIRVRKNGKVVRVSPEKCLETVRDELARLSASQ